MTQRLAQPQLTFFCELDAPALAALFADGRVLAQLAALRARVSMGLRDLSAQRAEVVGRLNAAGIPLIAWQLLPAEQGYWYNQQNAHHAAAGYAAFRDWTRAHGLRWAGVGVDIEPDIREWARWFAGPPKLLPALLRRLLDTRLARQATADYHRLIEQIRADGHYIESYVIPFIRDERRAGGVLLQRLAGLIDLPTDREVPMLYSSFHRPYGPGLLASYAPEGPAAAIGSTGGGVDVGDIDTIAPLSWAELSRDLRLARRHCDELYIFSLEGCVRQGFLERLADFAWHAPDPPRPAYLRRVRGARHTLQSLLWLAAGRRPAALALIWLAWWLRPRRRVAS